MELIQTFLDALIGTAHWTWRSIIFQVPWYQNYFWGLLLISLIVWGLEILFPYAKTKGVFRKDFWLDAGYMFFNFFIFSIAIEGFYQVIGLWSGYFGLGIADFAVVDISTWAPLWSLLVFFCCFGLCPMGNTYSPSSHSLFMAISSGTPQCERDGVCRTLSLPLDGKHFIQAHENTSGDAFGWV